MIYSIYIKTLRCFFNKRYMRKVYKVFLLTTFILFGRKTNEMVYINKQISKSEIVIPKLTIIESINVVSKEEPENSYVKIYSATWYNLHGNHTASGEIFHRDSLTAAYNSAKFGTYLKVTNVKNKESVIVKVTDRMGDKKVNRIDLSISAFDSISPISAGRLVVTIEEIKKPTI